MQDTIDTKVDIIQSSKMTIKDVDALHIPLYAPIEVRTYSIPRGALKDDDTDTIIGYYAGTRVVEYPRRSFETIMYHKRLTNGACNTRPYDITLSEVKSITRLYSGSKELPDSVI